MDILYYGSKGKEQCFATYAITNGLRYECRYLTKLVPEEVAMEIMQNGPAELVIDAEMIFVDDEVFIEWIASIKTAIMCEVIIIAEGYDREKSSLLMKLRDAGITKFITATNLGMMKEEYAACHEAEESEVMPILKAADAKTVAGGELTIAVAGCMNRIGTTTLALQLAKYFGYRGKRVAYLERNHTGYVSSVLEAFECKHDEALKKVTCMGVDLFYDLSLIKKIKQEKYDVFIYDYGVVNDENVISILEQNEVVITCGIKGEELFSTTAALRKFYSNENILYCFNFVHKQTMESTRAMMGKKAEKTHFLGYAPEGFHLEADNMRTFDLMFPEKPAGEEPTEKKKEKRWKIFGI